MQYTKLNSLAHLVPQLKSAMDREINYRGEGNVIAGTIGFLELPKRILDEYLKPYGLPPLHSCILFSRPGGATQEIHVDCSSADELELIKCAINFPMENCDDSDMLWFDGDYECSTAEYVGKDNIKRKYVTLNWASEPAEIDRTIIDQPTLVRVCIPHQVSTTNKHRKLLTFRFKGNPDYDEIAQIISKVR